MSDEATPGKLDKVTIAFIAALLLGAAALGMQQSGGRSIVPAGARLPGFTLARAEGGEVSLAALRGKVVVVNFWATWCPPCREEIPYLVSTVESFAPEGVELVAISNDNLDAQRAVVTKFLTRFPQLKPYAVYGQPELGHAWQVRALPSVFILDREGRVVTSHQGQATEKQLRGWIQDALRR